VTALVVVLLGAGGYFAFLGLSGGSSQNKPVALPSRPCVSPVVVVPPVVPSKVHVVVRNATNQAGLAAQVSTELKQRGFHVPQIGNTVSLGTGVATVRYSRGRLAEAQAVADQIKGATLVKTALAGVELDIGPKFQALLSPAAAKATRVALLASEAAAPAGSGSPCP
jgi:LytR cell envelope-related transcriptional attenuator